MTPDRYAIAERARATGHPEVYVWGRVHPANAPSQRLLTRAGFARIGPVNGYDEWAKIIDLDP